MAYAEQVVAIRSPVLFTIRTAPLMVFQQLPLEAEEEQEAEEEIKNGKADMILQVPRGFEKNLIREGHAKVQFVINAINGQSAGLINAYSTMILLDYNREAVMANTTPAMLAALPTVGALR